VSQLCERFVKPQPNTFIAISTELLVVRVIISLDFFAPWEAPNFWHLLKFDNHKIRNALAIFIKAPGLFLMGICAKMSSKTELLSLIYRSINNKGLRLTKSNPPNELQLCQHPKRY